AELVVVFGFGEFVDEPGGERVAHPVAGFGGGGAEPDEQVGFAGAGVADQTDRCAGGDPVAGFQRGDGGRVDGVVGVVVERFESFAAGEVGFAHAADAAAFVTVVAFGE